MAWATSNTRHLMRTASLAPGNGIRPLNINSRRLPNRVRHPAQVAATWHRCSLHPGNATRLEPCSCAPSHNVQISTDAAHGIIVGVGVTQAPVDWGQLVPALQEIELQTGRLPEQVVVDGGFTTREAVLATAELGVDLIG